MGPALKAIKGRHRTFAIKVATMRAKGERRGVQGRAAREAGYADTSADRHASVLMKNDKIIAAIHEVEDEIYSRDIMSAIEMQERLSRMGRFDPMQFMDADGNVDLVALRESGIIAEGVEVETRQVGEDGDLEITKIKVKGAAKAAMDSLAKLRNYNQEKPMDGKTSIIVIPPEPIPGLPGPIRNED